MDVTVKDIIDYLSEFNPTSKVLLDHDGWDEEALKPENVKDLIYKRGIFQKWKDVIIIQN